MRSSRTPTEWMKIIVLVLAALTCVKVWFSPAPSIDNTAWAQIPDAGAQRMALIAEARRTNELLLEIRQILADRPLNVRVVPADNPGADN